jgi:peptide/nickel transport system substrate-binding protein
MKGLLLVSLVVILTLGMILSGCASASTPTSQAPQSPQTTAATTAPQPPPSSAKPTTAAPPTTSVPPQSKTTAAPQATTTAAGQPKYGGTLRIIQNIMALEIGYPPDFGSQEGATSTLYAEPLAEYNMNTGACDPCLATSWDEDFANKTFTVHLRKGVKFHDNTDFNAEAVRWNFQLGIDNKKGSIWTMLKSMEIIDDYTLKFSFNDYPYDMKWVVLPTTMFSPTAIQKNGKDWAYKHEAATGPFTVTDYQQDISFTMKKFDNYWRKNEGYPYLDGIVFSRIGDLMVCKTMMESKQADIWEAMADPSLTVGMDKKGFIINATGPVQLLYWYLYPDTKPNSIFNDIKVRQAIASAINNPDLALAIGKGMYQGLNQLVYKDLYSYLPDYKGNPYNPALAKKLLADAGYPKGFKTKLTYENIMENEASAIQAYLSEVNIEVSMNPLTDSAWFPQLFGMGWEGLMLAFSGAGNDVYSISAFRDWLGPHRTIPFSMMREWSPEVLALMDKGLHTYDDNQRKAISAQLFKAANDQLNVIPLWERPIVAVHQPWVHSRHPAEGGLGGYRLIWKTWMDSH